MDGVQVTRVTLRRQFTFYQNTENIKNLRTKYFFQGGTMTNYILRAIW